MINKLIFKILNNKECYIQENYFLFWFHLFNYFIMEIKIIKILWENGNIKDPSKWKLLKILIRNNSKEVIKIMVLNFRKLLLSNMHNY